MKNQPTLSTKYILSSLREEDIYYFTPIFFSKFFEITREQAYRKIKELKAQGIIQEVEQGKYLVLGFEPEKVLSNPFFIATRVVTPSYVSFRSALNHYGLTEQVPRAVYVATARRRPELSFKGYQFKYVTLSEEKFWGYDKEIINELELLVAEPEKAIIDSLDQWKYSGGFEEVIKALYNGEGVLELNKLTHYAQKMANKSLCSRLGWALESLGYQVNGLVVCTSKSAISLDPRGGKEGPINKKWRVYENVLIDELLKFRQT